MLCKDCNEVQSLPLNELQSLPKNNIIENFIKYALSNNEITKCMYVDGENECTNVSHFCVHCWDSMCIACSQKH